MKQIVAVVKPFRAQKMLEELAEFRLDNVTVRECKGYGMQKDVVARLTGDSGLPVYLPKIEIVMLVEDELVDRIVDRIVSIARTGRAGDGKILVYSVLAELDF